MLNNIEIQLLRNMYAREARKRNLQTAADKMIESTLKHAATGNQACIKFMESSLFDSWCDLLGLSADTLRYAIKKIA